jgi:hypothetical protein
LDWSPIRWINGIFGAVLAMAYVAGWYYLFALPLIAVYAFGFALALWITGSSETTTRVSIVLLSPVSLTFLAWQMARFVGPAYLGIVQKCGIFFQRAHRWSAAEIVGSACKQREIASADVRRLWEKAIVR